MDLTTIEEDVLTLLTSKPLTGPHIKDGLHLIYEVKEEFLNGSLWPYSSRLISKGCIEYQTINGVEIFSITDRGLEALAITEKSRLNLQELIKEL